MAIKLYIVSTDDSPTSEVVWFVVDVILPPVEKSSEATPVGSRRIPRKLKRLPFSVLHS